VHALRNVHELLVPGGTLVDLHPVTEEHVEAGGEAIGVLEEPEWTEKILPNAETRLREAIHDGFYALEEEIEFDVLQHFDSAEELIEAKREPLDSQPALRERIRVAAPPLLTREHYVGRRLRVL
jgi:hypothetical protein